MRPGYSIWILNKCFCGESDVVEMLGWVGKTGKAVSVGIDFGKHAGMKHTYIAKKTHIYDSTVREVRQRQGKAP